MCGGTPQHLGQLGDGQGLSPRVRGNLSAQAAGGVWTRSIPACAGEPGRHRPVTGRGRVYPRVCGGTKSARRGRAGGKGLSPRVRGNRILRRIKGTRARSIPACAGEPGTDALPWEAKWVYPRVCGGTGESLLQGPGERGLSPRVRGNLKRWRKYPASIRSIPACAGEPHGVGRLAEPAGVYPRVCGGTRRRHGEQRTAPGLSPRVRGNPHHRRRNGRPGRSIPACAGEPPSESPPYSAERVYPRVCGGTCSPIWPSTTCRGLSPRVRGNPGGGGVATDTAGSIPACAGEPPSGSGVIAMARVYPRVCGGTLISRQVIRLFEGLSPRVRGNLYRGAGGESADRSIPACAGEP